MRFLQASIVALLCLVLLGEEVAGSVAGSRIKRQDEIPPLKPAANNDLRNHGCNNDCLERNDSGSCVANVTCCNKMFRGSDLYDCCEEGWNAEGCR